MHALSRERCLSPSLASDTRPTASGAGAGGAADDGAADATQRGEALRGEAACDEVMSGMAKVRALEVIDPSRPGRAAYVYDSPLTRELTSALRYDTNPVSLSVKSVLFSKRVDSEDHFSDAAKTARLQGGGPFQPPAPLFNPPAVHTVRWEEVMPALDDQERYVVEAVLSYDTFLQRVLAGRQPPERAGSRQVRGVCRAWQRELRHAGYVRRAPGGVIPAVICPLFAVERSDGKLRLIFDGRELNDLAIRPPVTRLGRIGDELSRLAHDPEVRCMVALDFKSWFVQLRPDQRVADVFFRSSLGELGDVVVQGLPMGFAWAPVIAQSVALAFARTVRNELEAKGIHVQCSFTYIDNVLFGIRNPAEAHHVRESCARVASRWGIVIKPSSWDVGAEVEWRGTRIDAAAGRARLVDKFVVKVRTAIQAADRKGWALPVADTVPLISCLIYATYVRDRPLADIIEPLRMLSRLASSLNKGDITHASVQRWGRDAAAAATTIGDGLADWWIPRRRRAPGAQDSVAPRVTGVSDAAGPSESGESRCWAYAYHSHHQMVVHVESIGDNTDIFELELMAMAAGVLDAQGDVLGSAPGAAPSESGQEGLLHWSCDNLRAIFVLDRGWSALWKVNATLAQWYHSVLPRYEEIQVAYVQSAHNIVDVFTRAARPGRITAPACPKHPGRECAEFLDFVGRAQVELGCTERAPRRALTWATRSRVVTFAPDMPPSAMPV